MQAKVHTTHIDPTSEKGKQVVELLKLLGLPVPDELEKAIKTPKPATETGPIEHPFASFLRSLRSLREEEQEAGGSEQGHAPMSVEEQTKILANFIDSPRRFELGARVVRNTHGLARYNGPEKGQVAMVSHVFASPKLDDNGQVVHGEIALVCPLDGHVHACTVDFRYYRLAEKGE